MVNNSHQLVLYLFNAPNVNIYFDIYFCKSEQRMCGTKGCLNQWIWNKRRNKQHIDIYLSTRESLMGWVIEKKRDGEVVNRIAEAVEEEDLNMSLYCLIDDFRCEIFEQNLPTLLISLSIPSHPQFIDKNLNQFYYFYSRRSKGLYWQHLHLLKDTVQ